MFLELLSDVVLDDEIDEPSPEAAPREPVVAVVSSLTAAELDRLGHARGPGVAGVAIVVHLDADLLTPDDRERDSPRDVAKALAESGWRVIETASNADREPILQTPGVLRG
jgi:hypothetical protein